MKSRTATPGGSPRLWNAWTSARRNGSLWRSEPERAGRGPLRAIPLARPDEGATCGPRPATVTVVATDGSQIFPDRHADPACYLLNVGRIALHYGTLDAPLMVAEPDFRYSRTDLDDLAPEDPESPEASAEVVSALRDEQELGWLHRTAFDERRSGRDLVALADGTLIRWMLRGMKNRSLEKTLLARYVAILDRFQADGIPLASYISRPGAAEVVNLLRLHRGEGDWDRGTDSLHGLLDRHLFEEVLGVGERSATFASRSEVLSEYGPHKIVAFYLRLPGEVARVEMPEWAAQVPGWLDSGAFGPARSGREGRGLPHHPARGARAGRRPRGGAGDVLPAPGGPPPARRSRLWRQRQERLEAGAARVRDGARFVSPEARGDGRPQTTGTASGGAKVS